MDKYHISRIAGELKGLADSFAKDYEAARKASEDNYKLSLPAGASFKTRKGFYDDAAESKFEITADSYRKRAHAIADGLTKELTGGMLDAPTPEMINTIQMLNFRKDVTADEIDLLMTKYKDNYQMYKALKDYANEKGYHDFKDHPLSAVIEALFDVSRFIDRTFSASTAENGLSISLAAFRAYCDNLGAE